jgi:predicted dehydrogenase
MSPVRLVVIGVGNFGSLHAITLAGLAEAELVGVVDADPRALHALRQRLPDITAYNTLDRAMAEGKADAFVIATRTDSHVFIAKQLLDAGYAVLIEKPLGSLEHWHFVLWRDVVKDLSPAWFDRSKSEDDTAAGT